MTRSTSIAFAFVFTVPFASDPADAQPEFGTPRRCVLISLDGLRPDAIDAANAVMLKSLIAAGAYDPACINELPPATLPNHASMVTGQPVQMHGVILNIELSGHLRGPTLFDMATRAGRRVAFFASKNKLSFLCRPDSAAVFVIEPDEDRLTDAIVSLLAADPPDLMFIHYGEPDGAGHKYGWMTPEYLEQVRHVDALVRRVVVALKANDLQDDTVLVISSDHGGQNKSHFLNTPLERNVPLILHGRGVPAGRALAGPTYVRDIAPIAAAILGLDTSDDWRARVPKDAFDSSSVPVAAHAEPPPASHTLHPTPYTLTTAWGMAPLGLVATGTVLIWVSARRRGSSK